MKLLAFAFLLALNAASHAIGEGGDTPWPAGARLEVQLKLSATPDKDGKLKIAGELIVTNPTDAAVTIQKATNRGVLAFFVSDELGNPVASQGTGKVDPAFDTLNLAPRSTHTHRFEGLAYVTGSSERGYTLIPGKTYRVIAVYRPAGRLGPGFTSQEVVLVMPLCG
jgi:hypothetical protein